jgi:methylenetetrahydrofolate dehydrogenase (NADP+) / methenyltetrahydrofolate cyclohydrolase
MTAVGRDQPVNAITLSGRELAAQIRESVTAATSARPQGARPPVLAVVMASADEATAWYVRSITSAAGKVGITCRVVDLGQDAAPAAITGALADLSVDESVSAIVLQTPLPGGAKLAEFGHLIDPAKDVDGANPLSLGRLAAGLPAFAPATAEAIIALLDHYQVEITGRHAVIVGRSTVVGKPAAHLLLDRHASVTICHSRTRDLPAITRTADILVAAVGRRWLLTADHIQPGAVVIDVGTNPTSDGGITGDVDPSAAEVAGALSPVPGGVGPVTTALLLDHVLRAYAGATGSMMARTGG